MLTGRLTRGVASGLAVQTRSRLRFDWETALLAVSATVAALSVVGFAIAGAFRATFPYPLDVQEDASVEMLRRLAVGQPVYAPPTLEYVPAVYPPLYYQLSSVVALVTGVGLMPLRLVSLFASLGALALVYGLVRRETDSRAMALIAAGIFAATTELSLQSLDLARVDALGVFFMLGALYAMRGADMQMRRAGLLAALSGLCAGLAFATKQPNLLLGGLLLAYAAWSPRTHLAPYAVTLLLSAAVSVLAVYLNSGEWSRFYLMDLVRNHGLDDQHVLNFWSVDVLPRFTLPLLLGPLFLVGRAAARQWRTAAFYALATFGLIGLAWGGWANRDSSFNVYEPAFAILSVLFALGINEGATLLAQQGSGARVVSRYLLALAIGQFAVLAYNPRATIPPRSDIWAGDRLAAEIAGLPGRVFAPRYGEWSVRAGRGPQPSITGMMELAGGFGGQPLPQGQAFLDQLSDALSRRDYDYVLWEPLSEAFAVKGRIEGAGYVDIGPLFPTNDLFDQWKSGYTPDVDVYVPAERAGAERARFGGSGT